MFIEKAKRLYERKDGSIEKYEDFTKHERNELADLLTVMIEKGQYVMHENRKVYEKVLLFDITNTYFEGKYDKSKICVPQKITSKKSAS